jgi:hypothetical protein
VCVCGPFAPTERTLIKVGLVSIPGVLSMAQHPFDTGLLRYFSLPRKESEPLRTLTLPKYRFVKGYDTKKFPTVVRLSFTLPALPRTFRSARSQSSAGEPLRKARASQNSYARAAIFCCLADSQRSSFVTVIFIAWFVMSHFRSDRFSARSRSSAKPSCHTPYLSVSKENACEPTKRNHPPCHRVFNLRSPVFITWLESFPRT